MFTGIIEALGTIRKIETEGTNVHFSIESSISPELKVDQSVAHNGACLTVTAIEGNVHQVTAIDETIKKTNLGSWREGDEVNLERCMAANGRFDGHMVYGHVDATGTCIKVEPQDGSTLFTIAFEPSDESILVEKGSITLNGISLTIFDVKENQFTIAIIPYTLNHTSMHSLKEGVDVNLEFDILGKYINTLLARRGV